MKLTKKKYNNKNKINNKGFMLIEIIMVIIIVSILILTIYQFFGFTYRSSYVGIDEQQIEDQINNFFVSIARDIRNLESTKNIQIMSNQLIIYENDPNSPDIVYKINNNNIEKNNKIIVKSINNYSISPPLFQQNANYNIIDVTVNLSRNDVRAWSSSKVNNFSTQIIRRNPISSPSPSS